MSKGPTHYELIAWMVCFHCICGSIPQLLWCLCPWLWRATFWVHPQNPGSLDLFGEHLNKWLSPPMSQKLAGTSQWMDSVYGSYGIGHCLHLLRTLSEDCKVQKMHWPNCNSLTRSKVSWCMQYVQIWLRTCKASEALFILTKKDRILSGPDQK